MLEELKQLINIHPKGLTTNNGLLIGRSKWGIFTHASFPCEIYDFISKEDSFEMSIHTDGDSEYDFIEGFKLESLEQIMNLSHQRSWMRYLNGNAEITLNLIAFEFALTFRLYKYKTMIYCPTLHFYDEVYDHLTIEEDFEQYLLKHQDYLLDVIYKK